jgi:hypothetical protein
MNTNTRNLPILHTALVLLCFLAIFTGCSGKSKIPNEIDYIPERLIHDFSDMRENEFVSRAWVRRGFTLSNCHSITFEPVIDSSRIPNPAAVKRFEQGLHALFEVYNNKKGEHTVKIQTTVIDVKSNPGRIKKMFLDFDRDPYIEVEIMITDQATGLPLVKIIHFNRDKKSLNNAITAILDDVKRFLMQSV